MKTLFIVNLGKNFKSKCLAWKALAGAIGIGIVISNSVAHSKGGVGNGGFILKCTEGAKFRVFDYEEFRKYGLTPELDPRPHRTVRQRVEYVLDRLAKVNPSRAQRWRGYLDEFFGSAGGGASGPARGSGNAIENVLDPARGDIELLGDGEEFVPVADLGVASTPKSCEKPIQLIQQRAPDQKPHQNQKTYLVDGDLWKIILDAGYTDVLAGIVLHELSLHESLYVRTGYQQGENPSTTYVRYLNALVSSSKMNSITQVEYVNTLIPNHREGAHKVGVVRTLDIGEQEVVIGRLLPGPLLPKEISKGYNLLISSTDSNVYFESDPRYFSVKTKWGPIKCNYSLLLNSDLVPTSCRLNIASHTKVFGLIKDKLPLFSFENLKNFYVDLIFSEDGGLIELYIDLYFSASDYTRAKETTRNNLLALNINGVPDIPNTSAKIKIKFKRPDSLSDFILKKEVSDDRLKKIIYSECIAVNDASGRVKICSAEDENFLNHYE